MQTKSHTIEPANAARIRPIQTSLVLGIYLICIAVLLLVQYGMSGQYGSKAVVTFSSGPVYWREFWDFHQWTLPDSQFAAALRGCLVSAWVAYAALLIFIRHAPISRQALTLTGVILAVAAALFFPPSLSADSYLYAGYGKILAKYHLNPYIVGMDVLALKHDPLAPIITPDGSGAAGHMYWKTPSVYGPVWTAVEALSAIVGNAPSVTPQILFLKLISAGFLLAAALGSSRLAAGSGIVDPRLAFAAVAFNPLLIIEGPGNAHNDLMVIAFIILSLALIHENRIGIAGLFLGLAAGVKLFPLLLIPWMIVAMIRKSERIPFRGILIFATAAVLPVIIGYGLFWRGTEILAPLRQNFVNTHHPQVFTLLLYACLTVWVFMRREALPAAWAIFATWLALYVPQLPYPWYLGWGVSIAVCGMDPRHMRLALVLGTIALMSELHGYALFG